MSPSRRKKSFVISSEGKRDFLDLEAVGHETLRDLLRQACALKAEATLAREALRDKVLVMVFEAPSTRTRVSFDMAMRKLGGGVLSLSAHDMQLERGETPADTARVLSRYADAILLRTDDPSRLYAMAEAASIPVINGLRRHRIRVTNWSAAARTSALCDGGGGVDSCYQCTFEERLGSIEGQSVSYLGDGTNNVAATWLQAAGLFGLELRLGCPASHSPNEELVSRSRLQARQRGGDIVIERDPLAAARGSRAVMTDVWISMGEREVVSKHNALSSYRVDDRVMSAASGDAIFLHCLPAHRGEEVSGDVIDGDRSAVWDEAENRMHVQKAILLWCFGVEI